MKNGITEDGKFFVLVIDGKVVFRHLNLLVVARKWKEYIDELKNRQ